MQVPIHFPEYYAPKNAFLNGHYTPKYPKFFPMDTLFDVEGGVCRRICI